MVNLATKIISAGFKYGRPYGVVIDVRDFVNPHSILQLRGLDGHNPLVQEYIRRTVNFSSRVAELTKTAAEVDGPVYVCCVGGKHRSVYIATLIAQSINIPVEHRDLQSIAK
jgi:RNase adaptor protein for sRNA GlmZ degradation